MGPPLHHLPSVSWVPLSVAALITIGAGLRVIHADWDCLTRDESFSWRLIQYDWGEMIERTAADVHPPLYYVILKGWARASGSSIVWLRHFSIVWGVASAALMYFTVGEAVRQGRVGSSRTLERVAGLLGAALVTFHADQIVASRTARMYSLGVFLAVASSWVLLRALRGDRGRYWWWLVYGVIGGLFSLTHYFAVFTLFAQGLFVFVEVARSWWGARRRQAVSRIVGYLIGVSLCFGLYAPWVPVMAGQVRSVWQDYWIPPLSRQAMDEAIFCWSTGIQGIPMLLERWVVWILLAASFSTTVWQLHTGGLLFALQAAVPWLLCLGVSFGGGQSVLQERYLIFSQIGLFGMVSIGVGHRAWQPVGVGVIWVLCSMTLCGTFEEVLRFPVGPPQAARAIKFVAQHAEGGDMVIASSYRTLNRLRYYASEARLDQVRICCLGSPDTTKGHIVHVASLEHDDMISPADAVYSQRAWFVFDRDEQLPSVPAGMEKAQARTFAGRSDGTWVVALYVREGWP